MADIFDLARSINARRKQASQGYASGFEDLPMQIMEMMQDNKRLDMENKDAEIRRDAYTLNNFEQNVQRVLETTKRSDVGSIENSKKTINRLKERFNDKYPQLHEDIDIIYNHTNRTLDDGISDINKYKSNKFNLSNLEKEQKKIIDKLSNLQTQDFVSDPDKMLKTKEEILSFYNKLSSLGMDSSNYAKLGFADYQDHVMKIKNMTSAHSGILQNLDVLNINEAILNPFDLNAINYALNGDTQPLQQLLGEERVTKKNQEKTHFDKIIKGIESYNEVNNLMNTLDWKTYGDGKAQDEDSNIYDFGELLAQKELLRERTQESIDGYAPFNLQLRDFKTVHPSVDIPWEEKKDEGDFSFEDNMIIDKYNVSQEVVDKNRKAWESAGSGGDFSDWFAKNYKPSTDIDPLAKSSIDKQNLNVKDIVDNVFNEVENPVDPRNPGSQVKSVKYTTSKETQSKIKENYGRGAVDRLNKLYQIKQKFGEESKRYKEEFEKFEKYLAKQTQKKQPTKKPNPDSIKAFESGAQSGYALNPQFTIGK